MDAHSCECVRGLRCAALLFSVRAPSSSLESGSSDRVPIPRELIEYQCTHTYEREQMDRLELRLSKKNEEREQVAHSAHRQTHSHSQPLALRSSEQSGCRFQMEESLALRLQPILAHTACAR